MKEKSANKYYDSGNHNICIDMSQCASGICYYVFLKDSGIFQKIDFIVVK